MYNYQAPNWQTQNSYNQFQQLSHNNPAPQFIGIPGRTVNCLEEIKPAEVPMDGSTGIFPKSDNSAIYLKSWNADGTIRTITYLPKEEETNTQTNDILKRLDRIESLLKPEKQNQKKGSDNA